MSKSHPCPCTSGKIYRECCAPYHTGGREVPTAEDLVRARYAAFALGHVDFLWRTLHDQHDDRAMGREKVMAALRVASQAYKYMGLQILETEDLRVLYLAKLFQRGRDCSFIELAEFDREQVGGGMRYLRGRSQDRSKVVGAVESLTMATFRPA